MRNGAYAVRAFGGLMKPQPNGCNTSVNEQTDPRSKLFPLSWPKSGAVLFSSTSSVSQLHFNVVVYSKVVRAPRTALRSSSLASHPLFAPRLARHIFQECRQYLLPGLLCRYLRLKSGSTQVDAHRTALPSNLPAPRECTGTRLERGNVVVCLRCHPGIGRYVVVATAPPPRRGCPGPAHMAN